MDFNELLQTVLIFALPVVFAITLQEAAHGYAANYFGDKTAQQLGRLTLNPLKHIDPIGTIAIPLILYFATSGTFLFGYAKPIPVNFGALNNPKSDMVWVSLAGPLSCFIQAFLWLCLMITLKGVGVEEEFFLKMASAGIMVNLVMFAINLLPIPPLAGGRILMGLLPMNLAIALSKIEPWGFFIIIALVYLNIVNKIWITPIMQVSLSVLNVLTTPLQLIF
jgi:Zn-dependent protease